MVQELLLTLPTCVQVTHSSIGVHTAITFTLTVLTYTAVMQEFTVCVLRYIKYTLKMYTVFSCAVLASSSEAVLKYYD